MSEITNVTGNNLYLSVDFKYADRYRVGNDNKDDSLSLDQILASSEWVHPIPEDGVILHSLPSEDYGLYRVALQLKNSANTSEIKSINVKYVDENAQTSALFDKLLIAQEFGTSTAFGSATTGLGCTHSWINIYNNSDEDIVLSEENSIALIVGIGDASAVDVRKFKITSGTIKAKDYFLVKGSLGGSSTNEICKILSPGETITDSTKESVADVEITEMSLPSKAGFVYLCDGDTEYSQGLYNNGTYSEGYIHLLGLADGLLSFEAEGNVQGDGNSKQSVYVLNNISKMERDNNHDFVQIKYNAKTLFDELKPLKKTSVRQIPHNRIYIGQAFGSTGELNKSQTEMRLPNCYVSLYNDTNEDFDLSKTALYWNCKLNGRGSENMDAANGGTFTSNIYAPWVQVTLSGIIKPKSYFYIKGVSPVRENLPIADENKVAPTDYCLPTDADKTNKVVVDLDRGNVDWYNLSTSDPNDLTKLFLDPIREGEQDDDYLVPIYSGDTNRPNSLSSVITQEQWDARIAAGMTTLDYLKNNNLLFVSSKASGILLSGAQDSIMNTTSIPTTYADYLGVSALEGGKSINPDKNGIYNSDWNFYPCAVEINEESKKVSKANLVALTVTDLPIGSGSIPADSKILKGVTAGSKQKIVKRKFVDGVMQMTHNTSSDFLQMPSFKTIFDGVAGIKKEDIISWIATSENKTV